MDEYKIVITDDANDMVILKKNGLENTDDYICNKCTFVNANMESVCSVCNLKDNSLYNVMSVIKANSLLYNTLLKILECDFSDKEGSTNGQALIDSNSIPKYFNAGLKTELTEAFYQKLVIEKTDWGKSIKNTELTQLDILQEECAELIQAISKIKRVLADSVLINKEDIIKVNLIEEISHVCASIGMCCKILDIKNDDINKEIQKKVIKYFGEEISENEKLDNDI